MAGSPVLISVVLDKSGSMESKRGDVIGGFNQFIRDQRNAPGMARMIVTQFSGEVAPPSPAVALEEVLPLTEKSYTPGGGAALFDAIAQGVARADAHARPGDRLLCLIITGGEENSSRETTLEQVKRIIAEREARGNWTFAYLGAAPERWSAETGMSHGSSLMFLASDPQASFRRASESTRRLRMSREPSTREFFGEDPA